MQTTATGQQLQPTTIDLIAATLSQQGTYSNYHTLPTQTLSSTTPTHTTRKKYKLLLLLYLCNKTIRKDQNQHISLVDNTALLRRDYLIK
jgi:hypothetical protein